MMRVQRVFLSFVKKKKKKNGHLFHSQTREVEVKIKNTGAFLELHENIGVLFVKTSIKMHILTHTLIYKYSLPCICNGRSFRRLTCSNLKISKVSADLLFE